VLTNREVAASVRRLVPDARIELPERRNPAGSGPGICLDISRLREDTGCRPAIVSLADASPSGDMMKFSLRVDGQRKGLSPTLGAGQTATIDVNVTRAFRITLQSVCTSSPGATGNKVTAVWVNPIVTP